MKNFCRIICVVFIFCFCGGLFAKTSYTTPVGKWKQYSDKTHRLESIIKIWQKNDVLYGKVFKAFTDGEGGPAEKYCSHCKGELHNKKIVGMTILQDMKKQSDVQWGDGKILDPKSGSVYKCRLTLFDNGKKLKVRGYIGFTLFGRTQVWVR